MVYNSIDDDKIIKEGIIYTVDEEVMSNYYKSMFGSLDGYKSVNFSVNGITYVFQESTKKFIAIVTGVVYEPNELVYEITNVEERSGSLVITSKVALVKDNKLYNINKLDEEIADNTKDGLKNNLDKFSIVEYTFNYGEDGKYYINNISKK